MKALLSILLAAFLLTATVACSLGAPRGEPWVPWEEPESVGYSSRALAEVGRLARRVGTTGLMVVVGGKVLFEYGDVEARGYMAAGRYSVMAMAYGKYVVDGTIDLDLTLEELRIDDREGLTPLEKQATIRDLLTSRSGVYHPTLFGRGVAGTPERGSVEPGSRFFYHPWGPIACKTIFELVTGRDLFQVMGEELTLPLGLQDFNWRRQNPGHERTYSQFTLWNLYVSTRDVARFGQLMLQEGEWQGEQLIPREWVREMTSVVTPAEEINPPRNRKEGLGFGYQWWVWDDPDPEGPFTGAFTYTGSYGQYLTVLPKLDMVVAHQVFAGWYGPPQASVSWDQYLEILRGIVAAGPS